VVVAVKARLAQLEQAVVLVVGHIRVIGAVLVVIPAIAAIQAAVAVVVAQQ
jgi:hypothetical protein